MAPVHGRLGGGWSRACAPPASRDSNGVPELLDAAEQELPVREDRHADEVEVGRGDVEEHSTRDLVRRKLGHVALEP